MLTNAAEGSEAEAEAEGRARRALLDLYEQTMGQPERWVLVDVLKRRLGPLSTQGVDVGCARWAEAVDRAGRPGAHEAGAADGPWQSRADTSRYCCLV
jgi:hypothetical protein